MISTRGISMRVGVGVGYSAKPDSTYAGTAAVKWMRTEVTL
jgi:hypothetical protein